MALRVVVERRLGSTGKIFPKLCPAGLLGRQTVNPYASADVLIVGHTHNAFALACCEGLIVNPGACCSRIPAYEHEVSKEDGYRPATFGVLELPRKRFKIFQTQKA